MFSLVGGVLFFCGIFGGVIVVLFVMMTVMYRAFAAGSGYDELARRFPATHVPAGPRYDGQSIRIGAVRWRWATTMIFGPEGLYLALMPTLPVLGRPWFNHHPAVLIPWGEFRAATRGMLYWQSAVSLTVGEPRLAVITMYLPFLPLIQQYTGLQLVG